MMSKDLIEFLTSQEIIIVYIISGIAMLVSIIMFFVQRNNEKLKQKHNTRELNKLVEQIREETYIYDEEEDEQYDTPILEIIDYGTDEVNSVSELIAQTQTATTEVASVEIKEEAVEAEEEYEENSIASIIPNNYETVEVEEVVEVNTISDLDKENYTISNDEIVEEVEEVVSNKEELQYTDMDLDQATARIELEKIKEELSKQEQMEDIENIALTNYEEEQEATAIISLEELVKKGKEMYEKNELTQYADEGNEPISIQDLERQVGEKTAVFEKPFVLEESVPENTEKVEIEEIIESDIPSFIEGTMEVVENSPKFKSSPVISPIYGIEPKNDLQLENTANYDKLDEEIKKTNEFLKTLKDLQNKLD